MSHNHDYDRSITSYTPEGRVLQVEYAFEAVKRGVLSVALKYRNGIMIMVDGPIRSILEEPYSREKIIKISNNIFCVSSGLVADSRILIDHAQKMVAHNQISYSEPIDLNLLVTRISNIKRSMTQYGGSRPFGVSMLFCGIQEGKYYIYKTDPSGAYLEQDVAAVGSSASEVEKLFSEKDEDFSANYSLKQAGDSILEIMEKVVGDQGRENIQICVIEKDLHLRFGYGEYLKHITKKK